MTLNAACRLSTVPFRFLKVVERASQADMNHSFPRRALRWRLALFGTAEEPRLMTLGRIGFLQVR